MHFLRIKKVNLVYINSFDTGFTRVRKGKGFTYYSPKGKLVKSPKIKNRIAKLVIPPAWQDVWICRKPNGHIQATGYDDKQRKQYIYHPEWHTQQTVSKFDHLLVFADTLPTLRKKHIDTYIIRNSIKKRF